MKRKEWGRKADEYESEQSKRSKKKRGKRIWKRIEGAASKYLH